MSIGHQFCQTLMSERRLSDVPKTTSERTDLFNWCLLDVLFFKDVFRRCDVHKTSVLSDIDVRKTSFWRLSPCPLVRDFTDRIFIHLVTSHVYKKRRKGRKKIEIEIRLTSLGRSMFTWPLRPGYELKLLFVQLLIFYNTQNY